MANRMLNAESSMLLAPYPNEHAARIHDPGRYEKLRRENDKFGKGIDVIWGVLKSGTVEVQAIRFDASKFTVAEAKKWLKDHKYKPIEFAPATGKKNAGRDVIRPMVFDSAGQTIMQAADAEKPATVFIVAYTGGIMCLGGWSENIIIDLQGMELPDQVLIAADHNVHMDGILGYGEASVLNNQLVIQGKIHRAGKVNQRVLGLSQDGLRFQASIGAEYITGRALMPGETVEVNGRTITAQKDDNVLLVTKSALKEVSIIGLGADGKTSVSIAASAVGTVLEETTMFEKWLKAKGYDLASLSDEDRARLEAEFKVEQEAVKKKEEEDALKEEEKKAASLKAAAPPQDIVAKMRADVAIEAKRIAEVRKVCKDAPELSAKAIAEGWTSEKAELEMLRAKRPEAPNFIRSGPEMPGSPVIEAALCLRHNIGDDAFLQASYDAKTLEAADKFRSLPFTRIIELVARHAGVSVPLDVRSVEFIRAAFSTSELSGIIGNVANKALASSFAAVPAVAPLITAKRSHTNFHSHTVYSLALSGDFEEVAPDGELQHVKLGEESWTRQVKTRGAILRITRTDLINDELGAFLDNANRLGRKGAVAREKVLFTLLNATAAGSSFFTTARGNYFEGATSALAIAALNTAVQKFRDQTGPDGDPVNIEPKLLLVPTALESTAKALMRDQTVIVTGRTSSRVVEPANLGVWAGSFNPLTSPWLSNSNLTGYSSTAWYLFAAPSDVPVAEIAYLNGKDTPTVEYFGLEVDPATLGVTWRAYFDFGAALAEYRAGVKSKGA